MEVWFFRMREDRRKHYDDGFRREALRLIEAGGQTLLACRFAMPVQTAKKWIMLYRSNGGEASWEPPATGVGWETKVAAARDHVENGLSVAEVMARYGIASIALGSSCWCCEYRAGGAGGVEAEAQGQAQRREIQAKAETHASRS